MKKYRVAGIIAEYNPIHKGHLHHITETKKNADFVMAVISSNFVQRGEPSLFDKFTRAEAAVSCGCDLVLELPCVASCHNGYVFAKCAVSLLAKTGVVNCLSFGLEDTTFDTSEIVKLLLNEDDAFKASLNKFMSQGFSFIMARSLALDERIPGACDYIRGSNNNLALCYRLELASNFPNIDGLPIERQGNAYNDESLTDLASATALRKVFAKRRLDEFLSHIAPPALEIYRQAIEKGQFVSRAEWSRAWQTLRTILLTRSTEDIRQIAEIKEGFENALKQNALHSESLNDFIDSLVSKRYTRGRVSRNICHILLNYKESLNRQVQDFGLPYIKPLTMNEKGRSLLREMKRTSLLPIVTTYGRASCVSDMSKQVSNLELAACEIWSGLAKTPKFGTCNGEKVRIK